MNSGDSLTDRGRIRQALVGVLRVLGKVGVLRVLGKVGVLRVLGKVGVLRVLGKVGVLRVLGKAAASEAQKIVITMGDDLIREIGQDVMHQLPH